MLLLTWLVPLVLMLRLVLHPMPDTSLQLSICLLGCWTQSWNKFQKSKNPFLFAILRVQFLRWKFAVTN
jgi:hypothetical protein